VNVNNSPRNTTVIANTYLPFEYKNKINSNRTLMRALKFLFIEYFKKKNFYLFLFLMMMMMMMMDSLKKSLFQKHMEKNNDFLRSS
jgi:hypothetical protein